MSETALNQDPKTGQFLPGNTWKAPAWRPGHSGHTARFTPGRLVTVCTEYIETQRDADKPLSWSSLALAMGLSRRALDKYAKGEIGADRPGIVHTLEIMKTHIESELESMVTSREWSTAGVLARLRGIDADKWGDAKQQIDVAIQQISVAIDPDSALAKRLSGAGVTIDQHPTDN